MDAWLAQMYGTGGGNEADNSTVLEKTAQAMFLEKLAEEEGIDLSQLSEEELQVLADEVLEADGQGEEQEQEQQEEGEEEGEEEGLQAAGEQEVSEEEMAKEAQAKFEEADFLGRVMAHAYTQELEKIGAAYGETQKDEHKRIARGSGRIGGVTGALVGGAAAGGLSGGSVKARIAKGVGGALLGGAAGYGTSYGGTRASNRVLRAAGGEGIGNKPKTAAIIEKLAERRAYELLKQAGYKFK